MGWVGDVVEQTRQNRGRLADLGLDFVPSTANFILIRLPEGGTAAEANVRLRARGVAIRPFAELPRLGECIRVTVGPWPMLEAFLEALPEVL